MYVALRVERWKAVGPGRGLKISFIIFHRRLHNGFAKDVIQLLSSLRGFRWAPVGSAGVRKIFVVVKCVLA